MSDTVLDGFYQQVSSAPEKVAVVGHGRTFTYQQIDNISDNIAELLIDNGVGPGVFIPLLADRTPNLIIGMLSILKTGAAYIPIDYQYPDKRIKYIIEQSGSSLVLATNEIVYQKIKGQRYLVIDIDSFSDESDSESIKQKISAGDPVYTIFTSGTTGLPKGVIVEHQSLENIISWHNRQFNITSDIRSTLMAGIGFDVAQWEIWSTLVSGGTLYLPDEETRLDIRALLAFFAENKITHAFIPTVLVAEFVAAQTPKDFALKYLFTAGEKLNPVNTDRVNYQLIDYYGPTESTIFATYHRVPSATQGAPSSIGRQVADSEIFILNQALENVATDGEVGELFIAGKCLARGYLNNPKLTAEKFIYHPDSNIRMYRSGDLARWLPDGTIQFLGRADDQIKIRGNRVELGEIETIIRQVAGVKNATAVVTEPEDPVNKQIIAFFTLNDPAASAVPVIESIKEHLKNSLPDYFFPNDYVCLKNIPLTVNGKTDKQSLLEMYQAKRANTVQTRQGYSDNQAQIATIWQHTLGHGDFGLDDSFFDVGGHSLLAAKLVKEIAEKLNVKTYIRDIYEHNTVASLAKEIGHRIDGTVPELDSEPIRALQDDARLPEDIIFNPQFDVSQITQPKQIFITGITGFIGIHLLSELLLTTSSIMHCVVRDKDLEHARQRIIDIIKRYSVNISPLDLELRVKIYSGDISEPHLGMDMAEYQQLTQAVDIVYHSASAVNFIQPYSYMKKDNVQGLTEIVRFAADGKTKPLILLSTISVYSWGHLYTGKKEVFEDDDIDQNLPAVITDIGYVRSKWVMEKIADLAAEKGLPLMVFRLGYATFHSKTGVSASYQWWGRMVKTCIESGTIPDLQDLREGLTTVDYMTQSIGAISRKPEALGKKFNLIHHKENNLTLKAFFKRLEQYFNLEFKVIPYHSWLGQWESDSNALLYPLLSLFKDNMHGGKSTVELYQHTYLWDCANVTEFLKGTGISEPLFDKEQLTHYLVKSIGYKVKE